MLELLAARGLSDDTRKQLIDYYKWIVTLATFVLTVSISLVSLLDKASFQNKWLLVTGWVLLAVCIFFNWLLVKRLVSLPLVAATSPDDETLAHKIFWASLGNVRIYGLFQNFGFLIGTLMVGLALVLNALIPATTVTPEVNRMDISPIVLVLQSIDWAQLITTVASVLLAILTAVYVRLTRKILDAQSDPCVIVSVQHDTDRPSILQLVIRNVGSGLASDISFSLSRPLPARAWGIDARDAEAVQQMTSGPLVSGLPALGPGEERRIDWGQYGGLTRAIGHEPVFVTASFRKGKRVMEPVKCVLDVSSFEGTAASESVATRMATGLKHLSTDLRRLTDQVGRLIDERQTPDEEDDRL